MSTEVVNLICPPHSSIRFTYAIAIESSHIISDLPFWNWNFSGRLGIQIVVLISNDLGQLRISWLSQISSYSVLSRNSWTFDSALTGDQLQSFVFEKKCKIVETWEQVSVDLKKVILHAAGVALKMPIPFSFIDICKKRVYTSASMYLLLKRHRFFTLSWRVVNLGQVFSCCFTIFATTFRHFFKGIYNLYIRRSFLESLWERKRQIKHFI